MKNKYNDFKNIYYDTLVLIKSGSFYITFNDDAYILNYLFDYKIVNNEKIGFPISNLSKVIDRLNKENINYYIDNHITFDNNNYIKFLYLAKNNYYNNLNLELLIDEIRFLVNIDYNNLVKIKEFLTTLKK